MSTTPPWCQRVWQLLRQHGFTILYIGLLPMLLWLVWQVDWQLVQGALQNLTLARVFIILLLSCLSIVLSSTRWWLFLRGLGAKCRLLPLMGYRLASFSVSFFTFGPQFGGEPVQIYLVKNRKNVPTPQAIASVILDRALDIMLNFLMLLFGVVAVIWGDYLGDGNTQWVVLAATIGVVSLPVGYLALAWRRSHLLERLPKWITRWRVVQWLIEAEFCLGDFLHAKPWVFWQAVLVSAVDAVVQVLLFGLALHWLAGSVPISVSQTFIFLLASRLAYFTLVPGGFGVLELSQGWISENVVGVGHGLGISLGLLLHAKDITFGIIGYFLGVYYMRSPRGAATLKKP